jgi:23S rRNA (guanosine2251-2'-O)-methyltransferase
MQEKDKTYIYGLHPIREALRRLPGAVMHLYVVSGQGTDEFAEQARSLNIPFDHCDEAHLPFGLERGANHQGIVALVAPSKIVRPYKEFISGLTVTPETGLIMLDELTDTHNVGAIIRSAAAFGVAGVLIPEHRQAQVNGTIVKVSAGMAFVVPLVQVGNVNATLRDLKEKGFWVYGLSGEGKTNIMEEQFTKPSVFVLGNEGYGIREKTEDLCDFRLRIPIDKQCESLNVSASTAVTLYAWHAHKHRAAQM